MRLVSSPTFLAEGWPLSERMLQFSSSTHLLIYIDSKPVSFTATKVNMPLLSAYYKPKIWLGDINMGLGEGAFNTLCLNPYYEVTPHLRVYLHGKIREGHINTYSTFWGHSRTIRNLEETNPLNPKQRRVRNRKAAEGGYFSVSINTNFLSQNEYNSLLGQSSLLNSEQSRGTG